MVSASISVISCVVRITVTFLSLFIFKIKSKICSVRFEKDETHFVFKLSGKQYKYNIETKVLTLVEKPKDTVKKNPKYLWASYSPDSTYMVYARKHNLYMRRVDDKDSVEIQAIGAGALNQAIKAIAIARGYLAISGKDIVCIPAFSDVYINGMERTALRFVVESTDLGFAM